MSRDSSVKCPEADVKGSSVKYHEAQVGSCGFHWTCPVPFLSLEQKELQNSPAAWNYQPEAVGLEGVAVRRFCNQEQEDVVMFVC